MTGAIGSAVYTCDDFNLGLYFSSPFSGSTKFGAGFYERWNNAEEIFKNISELDIDKDYGHENRVIGGR